ncbi:shikimate kinase [Sulfuricystis multivorans]|uniref:shikimate kinase n=1 Tax=Sulfuricystis multivorans TaxID=2211108 RepID=UPI0024E01F0C|nr:shikimate kinase [Sulfuricystis multivorans]
MSSLFTGPPTFLIGMMGAGKSTLGRRLAAATGREFVDLDREIERRTGVSVATIFEIEGEAGFRLREMQLLAEIVTRPGLVVATGGGVVLDPLNRARLLASRCVVYLHAEPGLIFARIRHDRSRPLLQVADPLARIRQLVIQRDPLYREVADLVVEAGRDATTIVKELKQLLPSPCTH